MKTIAIESPYGGNVAQNEEYLQKCIRDCLARGETPYASHQMLTSALDDRIPSQRSMGIECGLEMSRQLSQRCFYVDYGWTEGMLLAKEFYKAAGVSFIERSIL